MGFLVQDVLRYCHITCVIPQQSCYLTTLSLKMSLPCFISGVHFEDNKTEFTVERGSSFNLTFYTSQSCRMNTITLSNVTTPSRPSRFCTFNFSRSPCLTFSKPSRCFCDARTKQIRVYLNLAGVNGEKWKIHSGPNSEDVVTVRYYSKSMSTLLCQNTALLFLCCFCYWCYGCCCCVFWLFNVSATHKLYLGDRSPKTIIILPRCDGSRR